MPIRLPLYLAAHLRLVTLYRLHRVPLARLCLHLSPPLHAPLWPLPVLFESLLPTAHQRPVPPLRLVLVPFPCCRLRLVRFLYARTRLPSSLHVQLLLHERYHRLPLCSQYDSRLPRSRCLVALVPLYSLAGLYRGATPVRMLPPRAPHLLF